MTSLVLIPSIRARVDLPIIAAGGFGNGQGLLAALSLGADAVAMGTRFACTQESPLHENVKQAMVQEGTTESDTIYSKNFDGIWARVMKTPATVEAAKRVRVWLAGWLVRIHTNARAHRFLGPPNDDGVLAHSRRTPSRWRSRR